MNRWAAPLQSAERQARRAIASAEAVADGGALLKVTASFGLTGTHEAGHDLQALLDRSGRHDAAVRLRGSMRSPLASHPRLNTAFQGPSHAQAVAAPDRPRSLLP